MNREKSGYSRFSPRVNMPLGNLTIVNKARHAESSVPSKKATTSYNLDKSFDSNQVIYTSLDADKSRLISASDFQGSNSNGNLSQSKKKDPMPIGTRRYHMRQLCPFKNQNAEIKAEKAMYDHSDFVGLNLPKIQGKAVYLHNKLIDNLTEKSTWLKARTHKIIQKEYPPSPPPLKKKLATRLRKRSETYPPSPTQPAPTTPPYSSRRIT